MAITAAEVFSFGDLQPDIINYPAAPGPSSSSSSLDVSCTRGELWGPGSSNEFIQIVGGQVSETVPYAPDPPKGEQIPYCGRITGAAVCEHATLEDHGEHRTILYGPHCDRWGCPACYKHPMDRAAQAIGQRMFALVDAFNKELGSLYQAGKQARYSQFAIRWGINEFMDHGWRQLKVRHVVFSPPQDWARDLLRSGHRGYDRLKKEAQRQAERIGLGVGGIFIVHPYRLNKQTRRLFARAKDEGFQGGIWDWVRGQGDWWEYAYLSPHVHFLGVGFFQPSDEFYNETGWTYKTKAPVYGRGKDLIKSIEAVARYIMSHAGAKYNGLDTSISGQLISWNGILSNQVARTLKTSIEEEAVCPCGGKLFRYAIEDPEGFTWGQIQLDRDHDCWYPFKVKETLYQFIMLKSLEDPKSTGPPDSG